MADIGVEQRPGRDLQRHAHHLDHDVAPLARLPRTGDLTGRGNHGRAVLGDSAAHEHGLDQPALLQPEVALAGEQAPAKDYRVEPEPAVLDEKPAVRDEDFLDEVGMAHEVDAPMGKAQGGHVAVSAGAVRHEREPIAAEIRQVSGQPPSLRPQRHTQRASHDRLAIGPRFVHHQDNHCAARRVGVPALAGLFRLKPGLQRGRRLTLGLRITPRDAVPDGRSPMWKRLMLTGVTIVLVLILAPVVLLATLSLTAPARQPRCHRRQAGCLSRHTQLRFLAGRGRSPSCGAAAVHGHCRRSLGAAGACGDRDTARERRRRR